jgi:hypothetical protein
MPPAYHIDAPLAFLRCNRLRDVEGPTRDRFMHGRPEATEDASLSTAKSEWTHGSLHIVSARIWQIRHPDAFHLISAPRITWAIPLWRIMRTPTRIVPTAVWPFHARTHPQWFGHSHVFSSISRDTVSSLPAHIESSNQPPSYGVSSAWRRRHRCPRRALRVFNKLTEQFLRRRSWTSHTCFRRGFFGFGRASLAG